MTSYESRVVVPQDYRDWDVTYPGYAPALYTAEAVTTRGVAQGWADPESIAGIDFTQRLSYTGPIATDEAGYPLNPRGRTGLAGRGLLGKWGPNHAADPIVFTPVSRNDGLSVLLIERQDTGALALPGGMVDPGERVSATVKRELSEETGVIVNEEAFNTIYRGYVDDPRNTDNAWMETVAAYVIIDGPIEPAAGDDAAAVKLVPVEEAIQMRLYANHKDFILKAYKRAAGSTCRIKPS